MEIKEEEICSECGHLKESHTIGTGRCKVDFCGCREFVCEKEGEQ